MGSDKQLVFGSASMLLLKLLEPGDLYGYQMMEELARRSDETFVLKAGTLYPLLHRLEEQGFVSSYEGETVGRRVRRFYHLTAQGHRALAQRQQEWCAYVRTVNQVLEGGGANG